MTIKEMRAERERQEIGEKIREETTPTDTIEDLEKITRKTTTKAPKRSPKRAKDNTPQKISAETYKRSPEPPQVQTSENISISAADSKQTLPIGLHDEIIALIEGYCNTHDIQDTRKIHPLEWQAVCMQVGENIKKRKILEDDKPHGGRLYNGDKLTALLTLYGYICAEHKQVAFSHNFPRFAGVSREFFHDYIGQGLTSSRINLTQKAYEIQKASLVGAVTGGGSATVGNIFLSKALAGLQETVTVQHVSAAAAPTTTALPVFDSSAGDLIDSNGD